MNDEFIKVPAAWLETLVRHAKNVEQILDKDEITDNSDLRTATAAFVGHADSAQSLLNHGQRVK